MEEKNRREARSPSPATAAATTTSIKSTDSPSTEPPPRRRGQKRKSTTTSSSTISSAPPKRHAREKAAAAAAAASGGVFALPPIHNGPLTRARQLSDSNAAIFSALNAIKAEAAASAKEAVVEKGRDERNVAQEEEVKKFEDLIEKEFDRIRCRDDNVHVVPVAAGWFSWTNIHSIEKQTLRSFFNGKLENWTPDIYKEIRNWIMKKYHANPNTNIESKDLSELSVGEVEARQEVLEFLEHWGLINYHPLHQNDSNNVNVDQNTNVEKVEKKDSLLEKLYQFENEQSSSQFVPRANKSTASVPSGLFPESIAEELVKQEGPAVEYHCNSCSADCSRKRYHCQKQADFDLCSECYNNGKFGSGMSPSDFILMEPAEASGSTGGKWTDQETLLLLEALELFKENWNEIAEHVATKTKAQCILHFLQMPIEDSFLDYDDTKDAVVENGELASTNNNAPPVPKVKSELPEGDTSKDNSGPPEGESGKDGSEPLASKSSEVNEDPPEKTTDSNAAQPVSTPAENSNLEGVLDGKVVQGKGDDIVMKALKEAFHVAGCPLTPDDKLCFAEAGNSVMALAAFLTQLVEPGLANASARNSLKTISQSFPGSKLAERHSFILEDPPEDPKYHTTPESTTTEKSDKNSSNMVKEDLRKDKEVNHSDKSTLEVAENPSSGTKDNPQIPSSEVGTDNFKSMEIPNEEIPQVKEKPNKEKLDEVKSQVTKKVDDSQNSVPQNEHSSANTEHQVASGSEQEKLKTGAESASCMDAPKDTDMGPTSVDSDKTNQQKISGVVSSEAGHGKMEVDKKEDTENTKPTNKKEEDNVGKLKRAALATLSAAAVKAKLLANQEEDEIRQLATLLIEKQMRKLEIKLSYFTEMDNAMLRVREQLERSRQKLFNERAQIIASRLGIPPSSRMLPSQYPINRMPPGFVNSMMRPPMGLGAQRFPISRPAMSSDPLTTNTGAPPEGVGGSATQQPQALEIPKVETN